MIHDQGLDYYPFKERIEFEAGGTDNNSLSVSGLKRPLFLSLSSVPCPQFLSDGIDRAQDHADRKEKQKVDLEGSSPFHVPAKSFNLVINFSLLGSQCLWTSEPSD